MIWTLYQIIWIIFRAKICFYKLIRMSRHHKKGTKKKQNNRRKQEEEEENDII